MSTMMARLGRNEQLVVAGSTAVFAAYVLGLLLQDWSVTLSAVTILVASVAAFTISFMGGSRAVAGVPAASLVRIAAALVLAFALVDLGDMLSSLDSWEVLRIALTIVYVIGAGILAYGAWATSGGSLSADAQGVLSVARLDLADRFVYAGALGVIVGWFLLMWVADVFKFHTFAQLAVFAAVLVLVVRWLDRNPAAGRSPLGGPWAIVGLAAVAVVTGLAWLVVVIGDTIERGELLVYLPLIVFVLALASLGFGAFLSIGGTRSTAQPTA